MNNPLQRSPLYRIALDAGALITTAGGWEVVERYSVDEGNREWFASGRGVAVADESANGKLMIEGNGSHERLAAEWGIPPLKNGQGTTGKGCMIYQLRPDLFLAHTRPEATQALYAELQNWVDHNDPLVVTDITHGRTELLLTGPDSPLLLSRHCSLNFDGQHFPSDTAQQSSLAKTRQTIIREQLGPYPAFRLIGDRSLAVFLWQTLMETGKDLGIMPIGQATLDTFHAIS